MYNILKQFIEINTLHQELWESTKYKKPLKGDFTTLLIITNIEKWPTGEREKQFRTPRFPNRNIQNEESDTEVDIKDIRILPEKEDW